MGTDIHMYVERFERDYSSDDEKAGRWEYMMHEDCAYGQRNYDVFAVLADVRNGRGFAGCVTGEGFNVIAKPRGLPKDMSAEMARQAKHLDHTPSWLLLSEVLAFDWAQTTTHSGVVSPTEFLRWKREGKPAGWSGGVSGPSVRRVSNEEMARLIEVEGKAGAPLAEKLKSSFDDPLAVGALQGAYTSVSWRETYGESCKSFLDWARGLMKKGGWEGEVWEESGPFAYEPPQRVRLVFGFDS